MPNSAALSCTLIESISNKYNTDPSLVSFLSVFPWYTVISATVKECVHCLVLLVTHFYASNKLQLYLAHVWINAKM